MCWERLWPKYLIWQVKIQQCSFIFPSLLQNKKGKSHICLWNPRTNRVLFINYKHVIFFSILLDLSVYSCFFLIARNSVFTFFFIIRRCPKLYFFILRPESLLYLKLNWLTMYKKLDQLKEIRLILNCPSWIDCLQITLLFLKTLI